MYSVPNLAFWLAMENVSSSLSWSWVQQTELFLFLHSENVPRSLTIEAPKNLKSPSDWSSCPSYQLCSHVKSRNSITLNSQKSVTAKKDVFDPQVYRVSQKKTLVSVQRHITQVWNQLMGHKFSNPQVISFHLRPRSPRLCKSISEKIVFEVGYLTPKTWHCCITDIPH